MADIIRLLPDSVANQIAAGEVIQRPASVIKELVENAVDAGATDIKITVRDAGKTLIQVVDNGAGMSDTDVRMAFERHATSKIQKADDLFNLQSMGFRGEALPSICAISEVEVITRKQENPIGTKLRIEATRVVSQEPAASEPGTVISVRKLFYNVPARRKFLKSDSVELSNIMREFERMALVNHGIRMSIDTGSRNIELRPGTFHQRIEDIWKNVLSSSHLLPVNIETPIVKIEGYISRPEYARRRNPLQYLIVNGRNMRHPYFHKAIVSCYDSLIAQGTQPCYFLKFTVSPSTIDVNIHPTKNEIKFENEQDIWPILSSAVRTSLGKFSAVPSIDFSSDALQVTPLGNGESPKSPAMDYRPDYNPFEEKPGHTPIGMNYRPTRIDANWQKLYDNFTKSGPTTQEGEGQQGNDSTLWKNDERTVSTAPMCVQYALKYIITTSTEGVLIIDQHRAHTRILYEEYMSRISRLESVGQVMMFPETISLDSSQQAALETIDEELSYLGFKLEYLSDSDWQIITVPSILTSADAKDAILRILDSVTEDSENYGMDGDVSLSLRERMAVIMARSAAIKRGVRLNQNEMENLIARLFSLPNSSLTPNGNPVYSILTEKDILSTFSS